MITGASVTSHTFTGLTPGKLYRVREVVDKNHQIDDSSGEFYAFGFFETLCRLYACVVCNLTLTFHASDGIED